MHAECGGWDLLLVDRCSAQEIQIGIQAKLRGNFGVLIQALGRVGKGPLFHSVLVPSARYLFDFREVAKRLDLVVFDAHAIMLEEPARSIRSYLEFAPMWQHDKPEWVPPFEVPGLGGGRSGPIQITPWKIAAMKLCRILRERGYLTRRDFDAASLSPTWWTRKPRPVLRSERIGKQWRYLPTGEGLLPDDRWPEVRDALAKNIVEIGLSE